MAWQRARSPEQKAKRRSDLLEAAAEQFAAHGFGGVSLGGIAAAAGVSKANVYHYFGSKEEIFLALLTEDLRTWTGRVEKELAPHAGSNDADAVAKALVATITASPRFPALMSLLAGVLEKNVTLECVIAFKRSTQEISLRLGNAVHAAVPALSIEQAAEFLYITHHFSCGLWPTAHPSPVVSEVLELPEFAHMHAEYEAQLERGFTVILRGFLAEP